MTNTYPHDARFPSAPGISRGVYPYLGGKPSKQVVRLAFETYGTIIASGTYGIRLAAGRRNVLVDPAVYARYGKEAPDTLFDTDEWLDRQLAANVPMLLTDSTRIRRTDRAELGKALSRWESVARPTLVVLPIEAWWLTIGLQALIDDVRSAGRPVGVVLLHHFNALDGAGAVAGLLSFIDAVRPIPVVLLRSDVSTVGFVAHGAHAGFVGASSTTRHGPLPMRRNEGGDEPDPTPSIFVPTLHSYIKASKLPAIARSADADVLKCHDDFCSGRSLLRIAALSEARLHEARTEAACHELASMRALSASVLNSADPIAMWRLRCQSGVDTIAELAERSVMLDVKPWLHQWLDLGTTSRDPVTAR